VALASKHEISGISISTAKAAAKKTA